MEYRLANLDDLEKIWNKDIERHQESAERWISWKNQYITNNSLGKCATFVAVNNNDPIGQITILFSTDCSAVKNKPLLCNGKTIANMNAFRIDKEYEGQGHISKLVKIAENYAKNKGIEYLTIGSEAKESRNLGIYLHFGYSEFVMSEVEDGNLILYYRKKI